MELVIRRIGAEDRRRLDAFTLLPQIPMWVADAIDGVDASANEVAIDWLVEQEMLSEQRSGAQKPSAQL